MTWTPLGLPRSHPRQPVWTATPSTRSPTMRGVATTLLFVAALSCVPAFVALSPKPASLNQQTAILNPRPAMVPHARRAPNHLVVATAASLEAATPPAGGGTGITPSVINLFKNIVGSGVLALAAGVAAFSGSPLALLPSLLILLAVGAASAYTFSTIARVGAAVGASTYRETWSKIYGEKTTFLADATIIFMTAVRADHEGAKAEPTASTAAARAPLTATGAPACASSALRCAHLLGGVAGGGPLVFYHSWRLLQLDRFPYGCDRSAGQLELLDHRALGLRAAAPRAPP